MNFACLDSKGVLLKEITIEKEPTVENIKELKKKINDYLTGLLLAQGKSIEEEDTIEEDSVDL
jgi:hypothetical protein